MPDYLDVIEQHGRECLEDLDRLAEITTQRPFTRIERRAAERALQVLMKASIGVAKFWLRAENKHLPLDAYASFSKLAELQKISTTDLQQWRKIIGMRNALVHDYLAIDSELLQKVIMDRSYRFLNSFISKAKQTLR